MKNVMLWAGVWQIGMAITRRMGTGMKIHTGKIRNRFEPNSWKKESWFFVAYALNTGNENDFAAVSRYSR